MPILMYGLEACRLNKSDIRSLDFVVNRFFMKMFKTNNVEIVRTCQEHFRFRLPSDLVIRSLRNWNLANLYDCNFRRDFVAYLN